MGNLGKLPTRLSSEMKCYGADNRKRQCGRMMIESGREERKEKEEKLMEKPESLAVLGLPRLLGQARRTQWPRKGLEAL